MSAPIIDPVPVELLLEELGRARQVECTARGPLQVYCVDAGFPSILREIGRLREIAFRAGGGGTGKALDLDCFDTDPELGFRQLVVWDKEEQAIAGGYRLVDGHDIRLDSNGQPDIPSAHIFHFKESFIREKLPSVMELSRSFIVGSYQRNSASARKSVFVLDCLFHGICHLAGLSGITDLFGKVTFYPDYPADAFALLTATMEKHCDGGDEITPITPFPAEPATEAAEILVHNEFRADFRALCSTLLKRGQYVPPILKSYVNQVQMIKYFGSAVNDDFGNVVEMGIMLHLPDINPDRWPLYFRSK